MERFFSAKTWGSQYGFGLCGGRSPIALRQKKRMFKQRMTPTIVEKDGKPMDGSWAPPVEVHYNYNSGGTDHSHCYEFKI